MVDRPTGGGGRSGSGGKGRGPGGKGRGPGAKGRGAGGKGRGTGAKGDRPGGKGRSGGKERGKGRGAGRPRAAAAGRGRPASRPSRPRGPRPEVAIFAKAPIPGSVKTRLTPALGADEAADLYRALLVDTIEVAESADARLTVAFTPATSRRHLERLLGPRRRLLIQPPGDLGERIEAVVGQIQRGKAGRVVVVGSDCPGLTIARIGEAWSALETAPVVLGPADDGGLYLIGFARTAAGLLRDIPWSTGRELDAVRDRLAERGIAFRMLAPERDLDTPRDLFEWFVAARQAGLESTYPRTWKILHSLMTPRRSAEIETRLSESRPAT
ncbi:MAG TPA: TIGR04282 family arsenosugar biosynthesis glycosyltransferase [Gemmatimonadota bacterium]|nr:TIGR04282 family arsenosugar biosynthesis glycosyltransferase [Gemmatimonadota bacterium]